jgi:hypothetical protein
MGQSVSATHNTLSMMSKSIYKYVGPTEMRNALVHPQHKKRDQVHDPLLEAWNLGLWYLELIVYKICGYSGNYRNRLTARFAGEVENVP